MELLDYPKNVQLEYFNEKIDDWEEFNDSVHKVKSINQLRGIYERVLDQYKIQCNIQITKKTDAPPIKPVLKKKLSTRLVFESWTPDPTPHVKTRTQDPGHDLEKLKKLPLSHTISERTLRYETEERPFMIQVGFEVPCILEDSFLQKMTENYHNSVNGNSGIKNDLLDHILESEEEDVPAETVEKHSVSSWINTLMDFDDHQNSRLDLNSLDKVKINNIGELISIEEDERTPDNALGLDIYRVQLDQYGNPVSEEEHQPPLLDVRYQEDLQDLKKLELSIQQEEKGINAARLLIPMYAKDLEGLQKTQYEISKLEAYAREMKLK